MPKKRKTRQEKIILQLKRQLQEKSTNFKTRQEAIFPPAGEPKSSLKEKPIKKKADNSTFFSHPNLIKKDLGKTLILALIILSLEFVLYLKLR